MTGRLVGLLACAVGVLSACGFDGLQGTALPGTPGRGPGSFQITVELPDVGTLVENSEVKVDDVAVGTVTDLEADQWHAVATVRLEEGTALSEDVIAKVGYNSLLGAAYLELAEPGSTDGPTAATRLTGGDVIPLENGAAYPSTEQVLAATSVVLNGGGLEQLRTITIELNRALATEGGRGVKTLLPRVNSFVGALDDQRDDIVAAIDNLETLSATYERDVDVVDRALDDLEPGLRVLNRQRAQLTSALASLSELSGVTTRLVSLSREDLRRNLEDLAPALSALERTGDDVVGGLRYLLTPPFAPESIPNACRGDYCNLFLNLDLSLQALAENFLGSSNGGDLPPGLEDGSGSLDGLPGGLGNSTGELLDGLGAPSLGGRGRRPATPGGPASIDYLGRRATTTEAGGDDR